MAAAIPQLAQRELNAGTADASHDLSTEALLTLIGVCIAVLGIALTVLLKWASLKTSFGRMCFPPATVALAPVPIPPVRFSSWPKSVFMI